MSEFGYWALAFSAFTSATLLPGSSEVVLLALLNEQHLWWLLWLVATSANVLGSCVNYYLGKHLRRYQDKRWFPVSGEQMQKGQVYFDRYGIYSLLLAWVPVVGDPLTMLAGVFKVRFWLFLLLVTLSKGGRYLLVIAAASSFHYLVS